MDKTSWSVEWSDLVMVMEINEMCNSIHTVFKSVNIFCLVTFVFAVGLHIHMSLSFR